MNYFNYFTEIEDTFIRRRGKHLLLSPMDWALIESWKASGVPLHIALRGIERAFDSHEAKPRKRSVKTLMYCHEEVEAQYEEWLESQVGAVGAEEGNGDFTVEKDAKEDEARLPFSRVVIEEHLAQARDALERICVERQRTGSDDFCETLTRAASRLGKLEKDFAGAARPDAERLEESLAKLEKMLDEALLASLSPEELSAARKETEAQLESYRSRMEAATYRQTFDNLLLKRLREQKSMPRLSLFYL
ncbi:MAG: hypothetical protein H7Y30_00515 [Pyrinomonadaceae bacterium]|nr:hypothetical protein [Pyrinomonadaceae bacterium]